MPLEHFDSNVFPLPGDGNPPDFMAVVREALKGHGDGRKKLDDMNKCAKTLERRRQFGDRRGVPPWRRCRSPYCPECNAHRAERIRRSLADAPGVNMWRFTTVHSAIAGVPNYEITYMHMDSEKHHRLQTYFPGFHAEQFADAFTAASQELAALANGGTRLWGVFSVEVADPAALAAMPERARLVESLLGTAIEDAGPTEVDPLTQVVDSAAAGLHYALFHVNGIIRGDNDPSAGIEAAFQGRNAVAPLEEDGIGDWITHACRAPAFYPQGKGPIHPYVLFDTVMGLSGPTLNAENLDLALV